MKFKTTEMKKLITLEFEEKDLIQIEDDITKLENGEPGTPDVNILKEYPALWDMRLIVRDAFDYMKD